MARPELPGAAVPIQPPVSPFRWAARTRFSSLLPKCSFIFRVVVVYWSWNCESCPEIKYFSLFLRTALLFQLIPARGRKLDGVDAVRELVNISTYPRKGAKNSASKMVRSFSFACLNFSVFVGFFSMNRAAAFSLPWLLYCDKMCYNRAKSKHLSQNIQLYFSFVVQLFHNL